MRAAQKQSIANSKKIIGNLPPINKCWDACIGWQYPVVAIVDRISYALLGADVKILSFTSEMVEGAGFTGKVSLMNRFGGNVSFLTGIKEFID